MGDFLKNCPEGPALMMKRMYSKVTTTSIQKLSIDLAGLYNVVAEGRYVMISCSEKPAVRETLDGTAPMEQLMRELKERDSQMYGVESTVLFGKPEDVDTLYKQIEWSSLKAPSGLKVHLLEHSQQDVLRTYSFLSVNSSWDASEFGFASNIPHRITKHLLLGDYSCAQNALLLTDEFNVKLIVNASGGFENVFQDEGVRYVDVNVWDDPSANLREHFDRCLEALHD